MKLRTLKPRITVADLSSGHSTIEVNVSAVITEHTT